jgi:hypothetical protein
VSRQPRLRTARYPSHTGLRSHSYHAGPPHTGVHGAATGAPDPQGAHYMTTGGPGPPGAGKGQIPNRVAVGTLTMSGCGLQGLLSSSRRFWDQHGTLVQLAKIAIVHGAL